MNQRNIGIGCSRSTQDCLNNLGCPTDRPADFCIKKNDTAPPFRINVETCNEDLDFSKGNFELKVSIWINSKLKKSINSTETVIQLADNIGFDQILQNNIVVMNRARNSEKMLITDFDENEKTITVQRGYDSTSPQSWEKGSLLTIFRLIDEDAVIEILLEDVVQEDGSTIENSSSFFVYNWNNNSTSLPGCYFLEFKLLEYDNEDLDNLVSIRKFPTQTEGFLINIISSPTE